MNSTTIVIGIDPGKHTGLAVIQGKPGQEYIALFETLVGSQEKIADRLISEVKNWSTYHDLLCIIERASLRGSHSPTKFGAMINRACGEFFYGLIYGMDAKVIMKTPMEWKGNTPKHIVHNRIMKSFGKRLCSLLGPDKTEDSILRDFPDALDALGIAIAGLRRSQEWFSNPS